MILFFLNGFCIFLISNLCIMEKYVSDLIGYYGGDKVCLNENGVPVIVSTLEERINRRVSEITLELNRLKKLYDEYVTKQSVLRNFVRSGESDKLTHNKRERITKTIRENRGILCGIRFYTTQLNREKKMIQKMHPKNMKKKEKEIN